MSKPPLPNSVANRNQAGTAPTGVPRTHEKGSILDASNMSITIGDGKNKVLSEKFSELSNSSVPRVSRQRSNPIAIRRKKDGESPENFWLSKSMPAPRAPIIGSVTEPSHIQQRMPDFSLPPSNPHISKSYGDVGTSMTRVSASMPNTSFMANAANGARRHYLITRDNEVFDNELTSSGKQGTGDVSKTPKLSRSIRAGSSGGKKTALSVLMEHPSESLLDELNLCKDDKEGRLLMEAVKNTNKVSEFISNEDSENQLLHHDPRNLNVTISDNEVEDELPVDDEDDLGLFEMDAD